MNLINQTIKNYVINEYNLYNIDYTFSNDELKDELRFLSSIYDCEHKLFYKSFISNILNDKQSFIFHNMFSSQYGDLNSYVVCQNKKHISNEDLFSRGLTNFYFGDYKKALNDFDLTLQIQYERVESLYYKSLSLAALNEHEKAIGILNKLIKSNHDDYRFWNDKGSFLAELNNFDEAHSCYDKSISLHPNSYNWSNKAILYQNSHELSDALECYDNAIKLDPRDIFPIMGKAKIFIELKDFESAEKCFNIAEDIDPADSEFLIEKGKYLLMTKQYKSAMNYFDKAIRFNHRLSIAWMFKAFTFKCLNRFREAELCKDKAVQIDSNILSTFDEYFE